MPTTVISHVYNEEYLIPFWLEHHKDMFNHGIIIDYNSSDRTLDLVREACPTWDIIQSRNAEFTSYEIDNEVMDVEQHVVGTKIALNTTEFLFTKKPLDFAPNTCMSIQALAVLSNESSSPANLGELFGGFQRMNTTDRSPRYIHSFPRGQYTVGRHNTHLPHTHIPRTEAVVLWFGLYPWNDQVIKRKLQIKNKISEGDRVSGKGFQHQWNVNEMLDFKSRLWNASSPYTISDVFRI